MSAENKAAKKAAAAPHRARPKIAVWKFASCDGCQLSLADCEDELLAVAAEVQIAYFLEVTRAVIEGPYDISLVEGSITTAHDAERIKKIREESKVLIAIGACATAGGIQALRNLADVDEYTRYVYARPDYIHTLKTSTPIRDHVKVEYELRGCPLNKYQLLETINAFLNNRTANVPKYSECFECKRKGTVCMMVAKGTPCLGPVTQAGCGNICPSSDRGCFGCFGPMESPNPASLTKQMGLLGMDKHSIRDFYRLYNVGAEAFRKAGDACDT
jgi:sulfhydrogenase subunit delta